MTATQPVALVTGASSGIEGSRAPRSVDAGSRWSEQAATPRESPSSTGDVPTDVPVTSRPPRWSSG